jgi:short-subunit dehydrogenase
MICYHLVNCRIPLTTTSEGFIQNGATVYISSRDAKACEQACKELNALGKGKADFIAADLYKEDSLAHIASELKQRAGSTPTPRPPCTNPL